METTLSKEASEENVEKALKEYKPNPALQSALAIMPKSFQAVMEMANVFAKSGIVPDAIKGKPEACAIAIMHGLELGVSPTQAVNNIMIVNGRPSVWGDLMLALALGSNQLESFEEDAPDMAAKNGYGRCVCKRNGADNPVVRTFSLEDARRAGLLTKDTWRNYPGRMLMYRARSWALRDCIPHVLKGLMMREEAEDYPTATGVQMPERASKEHLVKRTETAQGAAILEAQVVGPENEANANPGPILEAESGSENKQPTEKPASTKGYEFKKDPTFPIGIDERKELFKMRSDAKIPLQDMKDFLKQNFGFEDTAKLTKAQAEEVRVWFVKNAR